MKKKFKLLSLFLLMFLLMACGKKEMSSDRKEIVRLKFSDQNSEATSVYEWMVTFKNIVEEKSDGSLIIDLYPNASLVSYDIEPLQAGIVDFIQYVPSSASDLDSRLGAFDAPYIYDNPMHRLNTFNMDTSEPLKEINESIKDKNVILVSSFCSGYRQLTANFPIRNLAEMKGAKIRVVPADLYLRLFQSFGAAATPMAFTEVSTALITNVIDGQENPLSVIVQNALYEIQSDLMLTGHMPTNHSMFMNYDTYKNLSEEHKKIVRESAFEASAIMDKKIIEEESQFLETCKEHGMTVWDESNGLEVEEFKSKAMEIYDYYSEPWGNMVELIKNVDKEGDFL
ncbi:TRAP dicarboxylate transporter [Peptoniphilus sp. ING2-D1G]|nr:TRAP dicarboxylate transporter [Peptoniphilus sp. ING2-D1G]